MGLGPARPGAAGGVNWRTNLTMRQIGPLFGVSHSAAYRVIDTLGPYLALEPVRRETRTLKAVTVHTPGGLVSSRGPSDPDHPDPHHRRQKHPGDRLPDRHATRRRRPARRPPHLGPAGVAHRKSPSLGAGFDIPRRRPPSPHRQRTAVAAVLRNTAIGYHRTNGETNIARATQRSDRRTNDLIDAVISNNPT